MYFDYNIYLIYLPRLTAMATKPNPEKIDKRRYVLFSAYPLIIRDNNSWKVTMNVIRKIKPTKVTK